ncbi:serine hydrolase [candidate division WWE3 bacterium]|uniref:Serine hydrolase n=1 Tax=candidate division WWE3 bacterium TaxID=2053526 RepID=A0A7X9DK19_UNCKA|nr:serine hydrolase [candidate division WWE3 bacterium]
MPRGRPKRPKIPKRIIKLWLPTAGLVILFTVLIWVITEQYNRQILGQSTGLPRASYFPSGFFPSKHSENTEDTFAYLKKIVEGKKGNYSIYIQNLTTEKNYSINPTETFYAASLYKVPVAVSAVMYMTDSKKTLDDTVMLISSDFSSGTGVLGKYPAGTNLTYREIFESLLKESDNTAQTLLLRTIPSGYIAKGFSLNNTFVWNTEFLSDNITSSYYYAQYLSEVYTGNYIPSDYRNFIFKTMENTSFDDRMTPYFKKGSIFSHKIGSWGDTQNWHDCGILTNREQKFVVCVMSTRASFNVFKEVAEATANFVNTLLF